MTQETKDIWITALRSGQHKQGQCSLYDSQTDTYCCLGVLAYSQGYSNAQLEHKTGTKDTAYDFVKANLSREDMKYLMWLNDIRQTPFKDIATHIEKNIPTS